MIKNQIKKLLQILVIILFYGGDDLNALRYKTVCKKIVTSNTAITPESLPPTSDSSTFHSYRAYHQVQVWRGENMDPLN